MRLLHMLRHLKTPEFQNVESVLDAALCVLTEHYMHSGWTFEQAAWAAEMERDNNGIDWRQALAEVTLHEQAA